MCYMDKEQIMGQIREIQLAILKVAKEIHRICEENEIKYIMMGGTFIGAARHKGFIPWDDDIDFGMTYDQYLKFIEIARNLNHPWMVFDVPSPENKDYANMFIKAYDKNTTFIEVHKEKSVKGVFVDIFPVTYCHDTKKECYEELKRAKFLRKMLQSKKYDLYPHRPVLQFFVNCLMPFVSMKSLVKKAQKQIDRLSISETKYMVALDGTKKDVYDSRYFADDFELYDFEDTKFWGIKDYHGFLTDVFKDYMKLPPEDKRLPHHINYYNSNIPFEEYKKRHKD